MRGVGGGITARGLTAAASSIRFARLFKYGLRECARLQIRLHSSCERQTIQRGDRIWQHSDFGRQTETERGTNFLFKNGIEYKEQKAGTGQHGTARGSSWQVWLISVHGY